MAAAASTKKQVSFSNNIIPQPDVPRVNSITKIAHNNFTPFHYNPSQQKNTYPATRTKVIQPISNTRNPNVPNPNGNYGNLENNRGGRRRTHRKRKTHRKRRTHPK